MSRRWKHMLRLFTAMLIIGGLVAGPALATEKLPPNQQKCWDVKVGTVDAGAELVLDAGGKKQKKVIAEAMVDAKVELCLKATAEANVDINVEKIFDKDGKLVQVIISAKVVAQAAANVFIEARVVGVVQAVVKGVRVTKKAVVKLTAKVAVAANVVLQINAALNLQPKLCVKYC